MSHMRGKQNSRALNTDRNKATGRKETRGKEKNCQVGDVRMVVRVDPANEKAFITIRAIMNAGATIPPLG